MEEDKEKDTEKKGKKKRKLPEVPLIDGTAVGAPGCGLYLIEDGKRRWIPDHATQVSMSVGMHHVVMLHPEQLEAIPLGESFLSVVPKGKW